MKKKCLLKTVFAMASLFVLGGWAGWNLGFKSGREEAFLFRPASVAADHVLVGLKSDLNLTSEQVAQIRPLIIPFFEIRNRKQEKMFKELSPVFEETRKSMNVFLSPEQQTKLQELVEAKTKAVFKSLEQGK